MLPSYGGREQRSARRRHRFEPASGLGRRLAGEARSIRRPRRRGPSPTRDAPHDREQRALERDGGGGRHRSRHRARWAARTTAFYTGTPQPDSDISRGSGKLSMLQALQELGSRESANPGPPGRMAQRENARFTRDRIPYRALWCPVKHVAGPVLGSSWFRRAGQLRASRAAENWPKACLAGRHGTAVAAGSRGRHGLAGSFTLLAWQPTTGSGSS
jgi:hypothetical protein